MAGLAPVSAGGLCAGGLQRTARTQNLSLWSFIASFDVAPIQKPSPIVVEGFFCKLSCIP